MIQELHSMFGDYDKLAKCNTMLYDPSFGVGVMKKEETFDEFYAQSSPTIARMAFNASHKIATLKRLITTKLQLRIAGMAAGGGASGVTRRGGMGASER